MVTSTARRRREAKSPVADEQSPRISISGSIGYFVQMLRLRRGWNITQLANEMDVSPATISRLERGVHDTPHSPTLEKLANALGGDEEEREEIKQQLLRMREEQLRDEPLPDEVWEMVQRSVGEMAELARKYARAGA